MEIVAVFGVVGDGASSRGELALTVKETSRRTGITIGKVSALLNGGPELTSTEPIRIPASGIYMGVVPFTDAPMARIPTFVTVTCYFVDDNGKAGATTVSAYVASLSLGPGIRAPGSLAVLSRSAGG